MNRSYGFITEMPKNRESISLFINYGMAVIIYRTDFHSLKYPCLNNILHSRCLCGYQLVNFIKGVLFNQVNQLNGCHLQYTRII